MANDILEDVCLSVGLELTKLESYKGDSFYRVNDPKDKNVDFNGARDAVLTYVLGYQAAWFKMKIIHDNMRSKILEVVTGL